MDWQELDQRTRAGFVAAIVAVPALVMPLFGRRKSVIAQAPNRRL